MGNKLSREYIEKFDKWPVCSLKLRRGVGYCRSVAQIEQTMITDVQIGSIAAVTALGDLNTTWQKLLEGRSAIAEGGLGTDLDRWPTALIPELEGGPGSAERLGSLLNNLFDDFLPLPANTGLVVASTRGAADELLELPPDEWRAQPWDLAGIIAEKAGTTGRSMTISAACASGALAIINGAQQIQSGEAQSVLVVGIDLVSKFVQAGFARLHALSPEGARPFDKKRKGLSLGEGAACMLLSGEPSQEGRQRTVIRGWGVSCDARYITAPCREASGLIRAVGQTLGNGGSRKIGAVDAHGTGTPYNDAMEMKAMDYFFADKVPVHSVKGSIGHTLGAAGVIEAALSVKALKEGRIPPTAGLMVPEQEHWPVSGVDSQVIRHPSILTCNSGFGGINAALLIVGEANHSIQPRYIVPITP